MRAMPEKTLSRAADTLSGGSLGAWGATWLTELNLLLETATLSVGLLAGCFALALHYRSWRRGRRPVNG